MWLSRSDRGADGRERHRPPRARRTPRRHPRRAFGHTIGGAYAGRLLADLGADVVTVEPPGGHPLRRVGLGGRRADPERSAAAAYFLAGTRSSSAGGGATGCWPSADIVIRTDRRSDRGGAGRAEGANPGLVVVDVSTFGRTGHWPAPGVATSIALAESAMLSVISTNPKDGPMMPVRHRGSSRRCSLGCHAVVAALGALHARLADGRGQRIDVSALEAMVGTMATACRRDLHRPGPGRGRRPRRVPVGDLRLPRRHVARAVHRGRAVAGARQDARRSGVGPPRDLRDDGGALEQDDVVEALVAEAVAAFTVDEFLTPPTPPASRRAGCTRPAEVLAWEQLRVRRSFRELVAVTAGEVRRRRPRSGSPALEPPAAARLPAVGQHTVVDWAPRPACAGGPRRRAPRSPGCASST